MSDRAHAIALWLFGSVFRNFVKRSGVRRIRFHDPRERDASLLAQAGVAIEAVSKRLGHATISITVDRYVAMVYRGRGSRQQKGSSGSRASVNGESVGRGIR